MPDFDIQLRDIILATFPKLHSMNDQQTQLLNAASILLQQFSDAGGYSPSDFGPFLQFIVDAKKGTTYKQDTPIKVRVAMMNDRGECTITALLKDQSLRMDFKIFKQKGDWMLGGDKSFINPETMNIDDFDIE